MNRGRRGMHPNEVAAGLAVSRRRTIVTNSTHARHRTAALWSETNTAELDKSRGQSPRHSRDRDVEPGHVGGTVPQTWREPTWPRRTRLGDSPRDSVGTDGAVRSSNVAGGRACRGFTH